MQRWHWPRTWQARQMRKLRDNPYLRWLAPFVWMGVIFVLSAQSRLPLVVRDRPELQDILGHLAAYGLLAALWHRALRWEGVRGAALWAFGLALLYGISDEFHQSFVPGRHPDPFDLATDAAGAAVALGLMELKGHAAKVSEQAAQR